VRRPAATLLGCWSIVSCAAARGGDGASAAQSAALASTSSDAASPSTSPAATPSGEAFATAGAMPPPFTAGDAARPDAVAPTPPAAAFAGYCFSWVHLAAFSTDCFRSRAECESQRKQMAMGARDTAPCQAASRASCTVVGDEAHEHCFGSNGDCGRYRMMLARRGIQSTDCVER
jgi:hypothetical protein